MKLMSYQQSHVSDEELLQYLDGESSARHAKRVRSHLGECWRCRSRQLELENAIAEFVHLYHQEDTTLPLLAGPRAIFKARLSQAASASPAGGLNWLMSRQGSRYAFALLSLAFLLLTLLLARAIRVREIWPRADREVFSTPDSRLTPGATRLVSQQAVCSAPNLNNQIVPAALQRRVFQEYGIAAAEPRRYEVDYLITPALGGVEDIHNLWPQSIEATVWNAKVKDSLENRLREMVCDGSISLAQAQQEIASNWIVAYQKYFHTDKPLAGNTE